MISALLIVFVAVGCSSQTVEENTADKEEKQQVVVATSVAITEILDELGVKVSGVPNTSYDLPKSVKDATKVGSPMNPDMEIIKSFVENDFIDITNEHVLLKQYFNESEKSLLINIKNKWYLIFIFNNYRGSFCSGKNERSDR